MSPSIDPPAADVLVDLASKAELFHDRAGNTFATIPANGHWETHPLKSRRFKSWLAQRYYREEGSVPPQEAMASAIAVLEGQASYDGPELEVFVRVAPFEDSVILDLGNE